MTLVEKYKDGGGLVKHALAEFRYAGWMDADGRFNDEAQEMMCDCVLSLLLNMEGQGHSGVSAGYLMSLFKRLANFEVISPLKGTDDEWGEVFDPTDGTRQNRRDFRVFKRGDGFTYFIEGRVFKEKDTGCCFTNQSSRTFVTFPCIPKIEYYELETYDALTDELRSELIEAEERKWREYEALRSTQTGE